jgi:hypothetical protein
MPTAPLDDTDEVASTLAIDDDVATGAANMLLLMLVLLVSLNLVGASAKNDESNTMDDTPLAPLLPLIDDPAAVLLDEATPVGVDDPDDCADVVADDDVNDEFGDDVAEMIDDDDVNDDIGDVVTLLLPSPTDTPVVVVDDAVALVDVAAVVEDTMDGRPEPPAALLEVLSGDGDRECNGDADGDGIGVNDGDPVGW